MVKQFDKALVKCMTPECKKLSISRGLCACCYQSAVKLVKKGKMTWRQMELAGFCLPSTRIQGPINNSFKKNLIKMMQQTNGAVLNPQEPDTAEAQRVFRRQTLDSLPTDPLADGEFSDPMKDVQPTLPDENVDYEQPMAELKVTVPEDDGLKHHHISTDPPVVRPPWLPEETEEEKAAKLRYRNRDGLTPEEVVLYDKYWANTEEDNNG